MINDAQIAELCSGGNTMISPFVPEKTSQVGDERVMSFGLSSAGYDVSIVGEWAHVLPNALSAGVHVVDPVARQCLGVVDGDELVLPPGAFVLSRTVEYFRIPTNIMVVCVGKSTYARCDVIVNVTPIEPGFSGHITMEIHNAGSHPVIIRKGAIAQFLFFEIDEPSKPYGDGKYQGQTGITPARMK